jgi:hypothetical protein
MFKVYQADKQTAEAVEQLGSKPKFWFSKDGQRTLFKAEERGTGEDWAEKIAGELCELMGIPHVHYELAEEFDGGTYVRPGVICPHCAPDPQSLVLGNQLLLILDKSYPKKDNRKFKIHEYTVKAVARAVRILEPPQEKWRITVPQGIETALDYFVGYIMLDAWIVNQDRHHENWGAIWSPDDDAIYLAPTFDHGASLARNISVEERKDRLESKDKGRRLPHFAKAARSPFYESVNSTRTLGTVETFSAFAKFDPEAAQIWLNQIKNVTREQIEGIVQQVPRKRMSDVAQRFTIELLMVNQQRLLELKV